MKTSGCLTVWCVDVVSVCKLRQPQFANLIFSSSNEAKISDNSFLLIGHWDTGCQCKDRTIASADGNKNIDMKLMVTDLSTGISLPVRKDRTGISSLFSLGNKTYLMGTKDYMISVSV